jgi:pyruvate,water dikinase
VIVAVTTDAAWGPLFLAAGAVVVETGAAISHAAIVSRELGIPAAASVPGATRHIRTGSMITVDGNTGVVTIH